MSAPEPPFNSDRAGHAARAPGRVGMSPLAHPATPIDAGEPRLFQSADENEAASAGALRHLGEPMRCHGLKSLILALQAIEARCEPYLAPAGVDGAKAVLFGNAFSVEVRAILGADGAPMLLIDGFNE